MKLNSLSLLLAATVSVAMPVAAAPPSRGVPVATGDAIRLENELCRYEIGTDGQNRALVNLADGKNYARPGVALMVAGRGKESWISSRVAMEGDTIAVSFGGSDLRVKAKVEIRRKYFVLSLADVSGTSPDWIQFCNLQVTMGENVGSLVNAAWDDHFAACVLACNDRTDGGTGGVPTARAYREFGLVGAKVAILGVPTGGPDAADKLLGAIEQVELEQGLPHPTINGVWIKRAPERFASYLMVSGLSQKNVDQVVEFAKGGFGCVETFWWRSTPGYEPDPKRFPDGLAGMKMVADKIHAAGLQLGLHSMQGMVGWDSKDDPYLVPKADPRLLQDRHATLAAEIDAKAAEIHTRESTADWPERGDLYLEGEIVRYSERTDHGFAKCERGLHGTTVNSHPAGVKVGNLVNCFPIWNYVVYSPDVKTTMVDEICDRIAKVFNAVGADMAYFDGGEEMLVQPPYWRNQGRIALGVQSRLARPVILEGNAMYTHLSWHVTTRGGPSYDQIYFGRRAYTLRFKGQNPAQARKNLLTGDVGWFQAHVHSASTDAVTPDEVMLLCLKAVGGKAPISFAVDANHLWANKRMPEMLEIIRTCDDLKRKDYYSQETCRELSRPMAEHVLDRAADGGWDLRPLKFGPSWVADAAHATRSRTSYANPHGQQAPWVRIRARAELAPFGAKENQVLVNPAAGLAPRTDGTASKDLVQTVENSAEKTPDGGPTFCYRVENRAATASSWSRLTVDLPKPLDLSRHRRLGLWIRTEGQGGILNVQLAGTDTRRDHYLPIENRGWTYMVLDAPEEDRFFQYSWPYPFTDLMFTCWTVYNNVKQVQLYYNAVPGNSKVACWIGRIEALEERPQPLVSPALEAGGQKIVFPVTLKPDEYLEMDWTGRCRHFDPDGAVLGQVVPKGALRMAQGENQVRFSCVQREGNSGRAEITLSVRGEPLAGARRQK